MKAFTDVGDPALWATESGFDIGTTEEIFQKNLREKGINLTNYLADKMQYASGNKWERVKGKDKTEEMLSWILGF